MESTMLHCHVSTVAQSRQTKHCFLYFFAFFPQRVRPEIFSWLPSATTLIDTFKSCTLDLQGKIIKNALICMHSSTQMLHRKKRTVPHSWVGRDVSFLHKQWSQQTSIFCMTNRHLLILTGKRNPGFWWLMTGVSFFYSKKKCSLPPSLERQHWPIWITDCIDWWCLCHLLLSLWADSLCGIQSEPESSPQSHSLNIVDWSIHSAALATLRTYTYFSVTVPLFQTSTLLMIPHYFHSLFTHSDTKTLRELLTVDWFQNSGT